MSNTIEVKGIIINLQKFNDSDYVSLTDIVKGQDENLTGTDRPAHTIRYWMKNLNTLEFLEEWEIVHNSNFKVGHMPHFKINNLKNCQISSSLFPKNYYTLFLPRLLKQTTTSYNSSPLSKPSSLFFVDSSETLKTLETLYTKKVSIR